MTSPSAAVAEAEVEAAAGVGEWTKKVFPLAACAGYQVELGDFGGGTDERESRAVKLLVEFLAACRAVEGSLIASGQQQGSSTAALSLTTLPSSSSSSSKARLRVPQETSSTDSEYDTTY